ncbi:histone-lysine N-methyltransferase SETMAR [Trichonephila clavipes]|nr:histone-lysine N-methyltransferase SETMAR [Trichonephila clavipes]
MTRRHFSDESKFRLHHQDGHISVWWHRGENSSVECISHRNTGPSPDVMSKNYFAVLSLVHSVVGYRVLKVEVNKKKIRYILQFFLDKCENTSQTAEIANDVYGADTVTANYVQFWFRRFRSGIFDVKVAPHSSSKIYIKSQKYSKLTDMLVVVASPRS